MFLSKSWDSEKVWEILSSTLVATALLFFALSTLRLDQKFSFPYVAEPLRESPGGLLLDRSRPLSATKTHLIVPVLMSPIASVYEAKEIAANIPGVIPDYSLYVADNEIRNVMPASLSVPFSETGITGTYKVPILDQSPLEFSVQSTRSWPGEVSTRVLGFIVIALMLVSFFSAIKGPRMGLIALLVAYLAVEAPRTLIPETLILPVMLAVILLSLTIRTSFSLPEKRSGFLFGRFEKPIVFCLLALVLCSFAYYFTLSSNFRWSIFEERDFLAARQVLHGKEFPTLGPQLLAGGQTPGGGLYFLLAPLLALKDDPTIFAIFNKASYVAAAGALALILFRFVGPLGCLFGTVLFCGSHTVLALGHWPIHPNMSLFFSFLFLFLSLRFFVDKHRPSSYLAAFLLALLIQLHVTYLLLSFPFFTMLVLSPAKEKRKVIGVSLLVFLIPFVPYFYHELSTGFLNLRMIVSQPRYQRLYVPHRPLMVHYTVNLVKRWLEGNSLWWGWAGLSAVAGGLLFASRSREGIARFLVLFFGIPFVCLSLIGMGYGPRHLISIAAILFLVAGYGFESLLRSIRLSAARAFSVLAIGVLAIGFSSTVFDFSTAIAVTSREGEWAVGYFNRKKVAEYLITQLGITQEQYERQTYWWWIGWSMAPELYADERAIIGNKKAPDRRLDPNHTLFLLSDASLPLFDSRFQMKNLGSVEGITIFEGNSRISPNTFNRSRPTQKDLFIERGRLPISVHHERLKLLLSTKSVEEGSGFSLNWALESPFFSGYYQEIKTLWKPCLVARNRLTSRSLEFPVTPAVLGNLLYKTPLHGMIHLEGRRGEWDLSFKIAGYFDQSSMEAPVVEDREWALDEVSLHSEGVL